MADTQIPKVPVDEVQNPVEVKFIIDHSEISFLTNTLLLAKELGTAKSGFWGQSGRSLMTLAHIFHRYLEMTRRDGARNG